MIVIKENKIYVSNILVPEEVYIRTLQDSREGEEIEGSIKFWFGYKAYLKSQWLLSGINAPLLSIDNLPQSVLLLLPKIDPLAPYNDILGAIAIYFNVKYFTVLKECLSLQDSDISIIPF